MNYSNAVDCLDPLSSKKSKLDHNRCTKDILDFSLYDIESICNCTEKYNSSLETKGSYLKTSEKLVSRLLPLIQNVSSKIISLGNIQSDYLSIEVCSIKSIVEDVSNNCKDKKGFQDVLSQVALSKEFSRYASSRNNGNGAFVHNIANSILYNSYGKLLPNSKLKTRGTCYSDSTIHGDILKSDDLSLFSNELTPEVLRLLERFKSDKSTMLTKKQQTLIQEDINNNITKKCKEISNAIMMACPGNKPSYKDEIVIFDGNPSAKYQEAYNVASSNLDTSRKLEKLSRLCYKDNKQKSYSYDNFDYVSQFNNYSIYESNVDNLAKNYEEQYGLCSKICEDSPGPYPIGKTCNMRESNEVFEDLGCLDVKNKDNEEVQRNCRIVSKLYENKVIEELNQTTHEIVQETDENIIVDDDYDRVISGFPQTLVKFLGIEKDFHEEIGVKPDLVTESEFVAANTARDDPSSGGGVKDEYRESGKVKKEWINSGEIRDEFAGSGKNIDSGTAAVLNTSGFSAQGSQVVIPRSPEAKKINELVEKVKAAKARTQVFRERVDKLEREGKGVDIASRWNNPISSLGSFENNWGVGSDNPAIRGYNSDGTSFEYPAVFNNRFGGVDAGRGRGYGARGRELNDNEKFTKAMYDRGLKTNISGASNESVADGSSGGGGSVGGANSGGGILSSGGASAGGASRGPASGGSEMSEIAQHFKGLLGGEAAVKRDIKDVEMKQVRVFRNDYNDEGKVVLEELLAEHKDIKIGDPFIVYRYDNGDTYRATLLPLFDPDGKLQGYRVDKNDLVGKSREFANSIIASENFLR